MITLQTLFLKELAHAYDAECQLVAALPKLITAATSDDLISALQTHLEETQGHVKKLDQVFDCFDRKARATPCISTQAMLQMAGKIITDYIDSPVINAALIAAIQKIEHHEIAAYGCLKEWAELMNQKEAAGLLLEVLEEEKATNIALTQLAHKSSNQEALDESEDDDEDDSNDDESSSNPRRERAD